MGCATSGRSAPPAKPAKPPGAPETGAAADTNDCSNFTNAPPAWSEDDAEIEPILDKLMEEVQKAEPQITALLQSLEAEFKGRLDGLDHRIKSRESTFRKIRKIVDRKRIDALNNGIEDEPLDIPSIIWKVTDALRYTMLLETEKYTPAVKAAITRFEEQGMPADERKNFWPGGDNYQGINDVFRLECSSSSTGFLLFEIQFHTPESFKSKMDSHHFYETFRSTMDPVMKINNWQALCDAAKKVPVPEGVLDIPEPRSNPNPGEMELYAELALKRAMKAEKDIKAMVAKSCEGALKVDSEIMNLETLEATLGRMVDLDHSDSVGLQEAVNNVFEALNILVVFPEENYVKSAMKAVWALEGAFSVEGSRNGWIPQGNSQLGSGAKRVNSVGCGPGWSLQVTTMGEDDGVAFTNDDSLPCMVTLHTAASLEVQEQLERKWAEYRAAQSSAERKDLSCAIRQLFESVKVPEGALELQRVEIASV